MSQAAQSGAQQSGQQPQGAKPEEGQGRTGQQQASQPAGNRAGERDGTASQQPSESRSGKPGDRGSQATEGAGQQASGKPQGARQQEQSGQGSGKDEHSSQQAGAQANQPAAGTAGGSSAEREALKGDIQQLLKEMSSQLQEIQTQLQKELPNPGAGTGTDPNLYEGASQLPAPEGPERAVPIQLQTDQAPTAKPRPGGGTGQASKEIGEALPQQLPEDVSLSTQASDEQAVQRHPIPPEYRPVFERLSDPTKEGTHAAR